MALAMIRCSSFRLSIKLSQNSRLRKRRTTAIAAKHSGNFWSGRRVYRGQVPKKIRVSRFPGFEVSRFQNVHAPHLTSLLSRQHNKKFTPHPDYVKGLCWQLLQAQKLRW